MENSEFGRLIAVLVSPRKTFEAIAARPTWIAAMVVAALLGGVAVWVAFSRIEPEALMRAVVEQNHGREMPAPMTPERLHSFSMYGGVAGAVVFGPLLYVVAAALFLVLLRMAGSDIRFKPTLSVTLHGLLPFSVAALLGIPVALAKESLELQDVQSGGFLMSHLGFLAGEETSKVVVALLTSVDLFSIWCIVLLVLGFQINARLSRGASLACVGAVWVLGVLIKVGMAALR